MSRSSVRDSSTLRITPAMPPAPASSRLSISSCRTIWLRLAPIAVRIAISRRRDAARASSRLATLAQAISSTRPTSHWRTIRGDANELRRPDWPRAAGTSEKVCLRNDSRLSG